MDNQAPSPSPDELVRVGEQIYFKLKDKFEQEHFGEYVVIDIDTEDYFINSDKIQAIQEAEKKYPNKLFFIAQIGNLRQPAAEARQLKKYGWPFTA